MVTIQKNPFLKSFWKRNIENLCIKPYKFGFAVDLRDEQLVQPWTESQIKFTEDLTTYASLEDVDRARLNRGLSFFTQTDVNIQNKQIDVLNDLFKGNSELRGMLSAFSAIESVHVGAYSKFIDMMTSYKHDFYEEFKNVPIFNKLNNDALDIIEEYNKIDSIPALVYFLMKHYIIPEGASLFTFFCILATYGEHGFSGLSEIIRYSMKDELIHVKAMREFVISICGTEAESIMLEVSQKLKKEVTNENNEVLDYIYGERNHIYGLNRELVEKYFEYNYDNVTLLNPSSENNPIPKMTTMLKDVRDTFCYNDTTYNTYR